jgi:sorbitol/mannitol transport system substrate-binding protein
VTLEENVLRQRVTTDITTNGGQFDIMTIGMYETPIWGANGWLVPLDDLSEEYDVDDILPAMRNGLSHDGTLYAAPFYGESSMVMYRTDLMEAAGLEMPDAPTWEFIREAAAAMTDRDNDINGICLRGKAGWGEGGAFITAMSNSFRRALVRHGLERPVRHQAWADTLNFFVGMMNESGPPVTPPTASTKTCRCSSRASAACGSTPRLRPPSSPTRTIPRRCRQRWLRFAPDNGLGKRSNWLWAWALAIPAGTQQEDAAKQFIEWATSKRLHRAGC